jgi:hypothetical protein
MASDNEIRAEILAKQGRCQCSPWVCDPDCAACAALDPEWSCYREPEQP